MNIKDPSKSEIRKKVTQIFLHNVLDSDDDVPMIPTQAETNGTNGSTHASANIQQAFTPNRKDVMNRNVLEINTQLPYIQISSIPEQTGLRPIQGEARIVAPNVSKLSPFSAVEIRLESSTECVAVLCSVDVLKMRSGYLHDILCEQEKNISPANALQGNILWRDPIIIPENSPFEAAAFLESLHEGRVLFRGEWNYCWARLR
jgi:hypothetical protein